MRIARKTMVGLASAVLLVGGLSAAPASAQTTVVSAGCITGDNSLAGAQVFAPVGQPVESQTSVAGSCFVLVTSF